VITQQQLERIGGLAASNTLSEALIGLLRKSFPEYHFTYCMDDDVIAVEPVYESETFNLYLIDSRNHCLNFTQDKEIATGIVVAEIDE
jgi:hypothetical protein